MVHGQIHIGSCDRAGIVRDYLTGKEIEKVIVIGKELEIDTDIPVEHLKISDTILYKFYYRLLQEVNGKTLIVLNEVLHVTNRYALDYNCIRKYCIQTPHRLVFNYYPVITDRDDFMILWDFIQDNPFLKDPYRYVTDFEGVHIHEVDTSIQKTDLLLPDEVIAEYESQKEEIIGQVNKDPDIIPRRLLKWAEKKKPKGFDRLDKLKPGMRVCVSNLKVDRYYYGELLRIRGEIEDVTEKIRHTEKCA